MTKLKHFAFSFALAGALAFGMGTVTKAAEPASGTTITAPAAKTDISQSKDLSMNQKLSLHKQELKKAQRKQ